MNGKTQILAVGVVVAMVAVAFVGVGYAYQSTFTDQDTTDSTVTTGYVQIIDYEGYTATIAPGEELYFYGGVAASYSGNPASLGFAWADGQVVVTDDINYSTSSDGVMTPDASLANVAAFYDGDITNATANTYVDGLGYNVAALYKVAGYEFRSSDVDAQLTVKATMNDGNLPTGVSVVRYYLATDGQTLAQAIASNANVEEGQQIALSTTANANKYVLYALVQFTITDPSASMDVQTLTFNKTTAPQITATVNALGPTNS